MVCVGCRCRDRCCPQDFENSPRAAVGSFLGSSRVPTSLARICNTFNEVFLAAREEINVFARRVSVSTCARRAYIKSENLAISIFPTRPVLQSPRMFHVCGGEHCVVDRDTSQCYFSPPPFRPPWHHDSSVFFGMRHHERAGRRFCSLSVTPRLAPRFLVSLAETRRSGTGQSCRLPICGHFPTDKYATNAKQSWLCAVQTTGTTVC